MKKIASITEKVFNLIEGRDRLGLVRFFDTNLSVPLVDLVNEKGYTALHLASFKNFEDIARVIVDYAKETITDEQLKAWVN